MVNFDKIKQFNNMKKSNNVEKLYSVVKLKDSKGEEFWYEDKLDEC